MLETILKLAGKRKIRMGSGILKVAACFVDYESEHLPPTSRIVEASFVFSKLINRKIGRMLDVGCVARNNIIPPALAFNGWEVYGVDIRSEWQFHHPNFHFIQSDVRNLPFKAGFFDLITCISTIEHIGLAGYYGNVKESGDGDFETVDRIREMLKPGGTLLLTVPYQKVYFRKPGARIYDMKRLDKMLTGFSVRDKVIFLQDKNGHWFQVDDCDTEGVICLELVKN